MNNNEQTDKLIRIEEKLKGIAADIANIKAHADNGGWSRCQLNNRRISQMEDCFTRRRGTQTWFNRLLAGSVTLMLLEKLWTILA